MPKAGSRRLPSLLIAAVLLAGGGSAIGWAAVHQQHAPQPTAAAAGSLAPLALRRATPSPSANTSKSPAAHAVTPRVVGPVLPRSLPTSITIPAIHVHSALQDLGLNSAGGLQVPAPGPLYNTAAWYDHSPTPGQLGPAVIEGHIDSAAQGPSVFFRLGALVPGDRVLVTEADGRTAQFSVDAVRSYPKNHFPTATVYGNTDFAALRLITCGGSFDHATGSYLNNTVIFAHLLAHQ